MIATGAVVLEAFPGERARLAADPAMWPGAVEELLRYDPPSHYQGRVSTRPLTYHGEEIPEGSIVLLVNGAANRDPRAFAEPERYVADRPIERQVAFGHGIHFCLGAPLARIGDPDRVGGAPQTLPGLRGGPLGDRAFPLIERPRTVQGPIHRIAGGSRAASAWAASGRPEGRFCPGRAGG